jgi:hypothetical protein
MRDCVSIILINCMKAIQPGLYQYIQNRLYGPAAEEGGGLDLAELLAEKKVCSDLSALIRGDADHSGRAV